MNNEPVAYIDPYDLERLPHYDCHIGSQQLKNGIPLYTHPHPDNLGLAESIIKQQQAEIEDLKNANRFIQNFAEEQHQRAVALEMRELTDEEINKLWAESHEDGIAMQQGFTTQQHYFAHLILRKAQEKCNHSNFVKTEHLTGEGAMEYVEWFDNTCSDCGKHWTSNN